MKMNLSINEMKKMREELKVTDPKAAAYFNIKNNNWDKATYSEISKRIASSKKEREVLARTNPSELEFLTSNGEVTKPFYYSQTESEKKKVKK